MIQAFAETEAARHEALLLRVKPEIDRLHREARSAREDLSEQAFFVVDPTSDVFGGEPFPVDLPRFGGAFVVLMPVETVVDGLRLLDLEGDDVREQAARPLAAGQFRVVSVAGASVRITHVLAWNRAAGQC
jgi:hypothetical protein